MLEKGGFRILGMRMMKLSREQAEGFYAVHRERPFFPSLVKFMTEGRIIALALEREDAVKNCARLWARLIRPMRPKARFASASPPASSATAFMAPTRRRRPQSS